MKVFPRGRGGGHGPVEYVISCNPFGKRKRATAPIVLKGDPKMMIRQIDVVPFRWKYSSGVLSFACTDAPTDHELNELMDDFETVAFAGLPMSSRSILWVLHEENGRKELHFIVPRQEVHSGKAFNAFPPGWQKRFDLLRDKHNYRNGWARPDDPTRARAWQPGIQRLIQQDAKRRNKPVPQSIGSFVTDHITNLALLGKIRTRLDVLNEITSLGYEITRAGDAYITVFDTKTGKRERLRGTLYQKNFEGRGWVEQQKKSLLQQGNPGRIPDLSKAVEADAKLQQVLRKMATYNQARYGLNGQPQPHALCAPQENRFNIVSPVNSWQKEHFAYSPPIVRHSTREQNLIGEALPIISWLTVHGYGTRNIQYALSRINAHLEIPKGTGKCSGENMCIVRDNVYVSLCALGNATGRNMPYSQRMLDFFDYKRWQQHDVAAAWFTKLLDLHKQKNFTAFERRRLVAPRKIPKPQMLVDIHSELSAPSPLYQAIKHYFCKSPDHFPAWLSLQGIRRMKNGLDIAVTDDDTIIPPYPDILGSRLAITLPLIAAVQKLDAIINPDLAPPKKYTMNEAEKMDMAERLRWADNDFIVPHAFTRTRNTTAVCNSPTGMVLSHK